MIIAISGNKNSEKDLVGKIIQYLTAKDVGVSFNLSKINEYKDLSKHLQTTFEIKKFEDKLNGIICLLTGCTMEQLEGEEFKNAELGEEWWYYQGEYGIYQYNTPYEVNKKLPLIKPTYESLMEHIGTDLSRNKLHPNIWVNILMDEYKQYSKDKNSSDSKFYPNWIITDLRFPNELKAVKDRGGISIGVNRYCYDSLEDYLVTHPNNNVVKKAVQIVSDCGFNKYGVMTEKLLEIPESIGYIKKPLISETTLDNSEFDYVIENNNTVENLVEKVREILIKEKII